MIRESKSHGRQNHLRTHGVSIVVSATWTQDRAEPTHEEVICVWHITTNAKQLHQIMELAVYISAYLHRVSDEVHTWCNMQLLVRVMTHCDGRANCDDVALLDQ